MDATAEELIARLRRNPDDVSAYAALRAHYQRIGDYASLANLLEGWAGRSPDAHAAAQAFFDAGEIVWGAMSDRARSIRLYERALERSPVHAESGLRLQAFYEETGDQRRLAELIERRAEALARANGEPRDIAALHHRLGEIWEHGFQRADKAIGHYRKAFELDPSLVPAIYSAREIYRQAGNLKAAATLCDLEAKAEPDPDRKVALLRELAHMRAHDLADLEGGVVALKRALGIAPGELEVMQDLARIYLARADQTQDPMVADADRRRAADVLYQIAQKVPPADAVAHLETALDGAPDHDGALALLERIAERVGHFDLLPRRWVAFLARAPDAPGAKERRKRLAKAYLDAGQLEYAITCLEWLLEEGDADAAGQLVDLYRRAGRQEDVLRALAVASQGLAPHERIPRLREMVAMLQARGDEEGAIASAHQILDADPADPEALTMVEEHHRRRAEWGPLRELLINASRVAGLSVDARKQRLREVAQISERRLNDADGAIGAWKGVAALDPADREARAALIRLLESHGRWDDLVQVLEREALSILEPQQKADVYRRLAQIHREHRNDLDEAIAALRNLRDLVPSDAAGRDALCDALLAAGDHEDAVPMLRQRIDDAHAPRRAELLRILASTLEEKIGDTEGAFAAWARLLEDEPGDREALERMEAIDARDGNHERLLTTLSYRADVEIGAERAAIFARMGQIADGQLRDLGQAAEFYARAHELAPKDESVLDALCGVYDRSERYKDLVVLLRERARLEEDRAARASLYRRIARTLRDRVGSDEGAAEAYREVLEAGEDREALSFLRERAQAKDDAPGLDEMLERLARLAEDPHEKRDLLMERATLLAVRLGRPRDAIELLRIVAHEVDPHHVPALVQLADLSARIGDQPGLADALERTLAVLEDADLRVPVARRLSDLYEHELRDPERAMKALYAWADGDLTEPEPLRRLVALLEPAERWKDLVLALDSLADLTEDPGEQAALVRRSADLAFRRLGDVDGAWERLAPRVQEGDAQSEAQLRELASASERGAALFELYVSIAEGASDPEQKKRRYLDASRVQEEYLRDAGAALEAILKAFALALDAPAEERLGILAEVDRLAAAAGAWARLAQVYETLIRRTEDRAEKIALLLRHAEILDRDAEDPGAALDRALRACSLAPSDDAVLAVAEDLAPRAGRADELLVVYDRRRAAAKDDAARLEPLLRAVRLCEDVLESREQALQFLAQAVALSVRSRDLAPRIEDAARAIDRDLARGPDTLLMRGLVDVYAALAEDMEADPKGGAALLLRASKLLETELDDEDGAWGALLRASGFAPSDDAALDALESLGMRKGRLSSLDQHLARLVEDALDSGTAAKLLRRRGAILERLDRAADAADVYAHLKNVAPNDMEARASLRRALRRAGKHQDLLLAIDNDIAKSRGEKAQELVLRKESALTWERELKNKWEAIEAWQKVAKLAPDDEDARAALARLEQGGRKGSGIVTDDSTELALAETDAAHAPMLRIERSGIERSGIERSGIERSGIEGSGIDQPSQEITDPGLDTPAEPGLDDELEDLGRTVARPLDSGAFDADRFDAPPPIAGERQPSERQPSERQPSERQPSERQPDDRERSQRPPALEDVPTGRADERAASRRVSAPPRHEPTTDQPPPSESLSVASSDAYAADAPSGDVPYAHDVEPSVSEPLAAGEQALMDDVEDVDDDAFEDVTGDPRLVAEPDLEPLEAEPDELEALDADELDGDELDGDELDGDDLDEGALEPGFESAQVQQQPLSRVPPPPNRPSVPPPIRSRPPPPMPPAPPSPPAPRAAGPSVPPPPPPPPPTRRS